MTTPRTESHDPRRSSQREAALAEIDMRLCAHDDDEAIPPMLRTPAVLAERAYRLAPLIARKHGAARLHVVASQVGRALELGDLETARQRLIELENEIEASKPRPVPPLPAAWLEIGQDLGFEVSRDGSSVAHALITAFALAAQDQRAFASRILGGVVDDELRRLRYALVGHGLPPVRKGSVFEAPRHVLAMPLPPFYARTWGMFDITPGWLVDAGQALGVPFPTREPGSANASENARAEVVKRLDAKIAGIEDKRLGCLEARWLRALRSYVAEGTAPHGHPAPAEALAACLALGVLRAG